MEKNIEKEFKILLNKEEFFNLVSIVQPNEFVLQKNTYFDTTDHLLRNKKIAMRIRTKNNKNIFTLKSPNDQGSLDEYECICTNNSLNEINENQEIKKLLTKFNINNAIFKETCSILTYRAKKITDVAELCFDINIYNNIIDFEIEYEYKLEHDGLTTFNNILKPINKLYEKNCLSKIKRALDSIDKK